MDKAVLRNFAIESRKDLMEKIDRKIKLFYVDEEFKKDNRGDVIVLSNDRHSLTLTKEDDINRDKLIKRIVELGYEQVVEEAAYTWFNRIVAIRYMEIHDYLPITHNNLSSGYRVLSGNDNSLNPEILKFSVLSSKELDLAFNPEQYTQLTKEDDKFKYILKLICKKLSSVIPQVFGGDTDYIDLLIPDNMLSDGGIVNNIVKNIATDDFNKVEIIGWLYQYYTSEKKDEVFAKLKKNIKIDKNNVPSATQIFTPDWIVQYMVDNSLGNYLKIDNKKINDFVENCNDVEQLKFLDPCCGSGHILVYAYDLFYELYLDKGYSRDLIPKLILENNLYGLDVDNRAAQLSILAVLLKARENDQKLFNKDIKTNIYSIYESNSISDIAIEEAKSISDKEIIDYIVDSFHNAKEFGTLLKFKKYEYNKAINQLKEIKNIFIYEIKEKLIPLLKIADILSKEYDIVCTNPPYMGSKGLNDLLRDFIAKEYPDGKYDTFASFIYRCIDLTKENGYTAMMTPNTWLTINCYKNLRKNVIEKYSISSLLELSSRAFNDAAVVITSFVIKKEESDQLTSFVMLKDYDENILKTKFNEIKHNIVDRNLKTFNKLPNYVISPEIPEELIDIISNNDNVGNQIISDGQTKTGDNDKYLRLIWEVERDKIGLGKKWSIHAKGGSYRKWYGNLDTLIDWSPEARAFYKKDKVARITPEYLWYKEGITWTLISGTQNSFRLLPEGNTFNNAGPTIFMKNKNDIYLILAILNSSFAQFLLKQYNETVNLNIGDISNIPFLKKYDSLDEIVELTKDNIKISKMEWDSKETSFDFKINPLIEEAKKNNNNCLISTCFDSWDSKCNDRYNELLDNETMLDKLICKEYKVDKIFDNSIGDVSINKTNKLSEIKALISYSVGCMFGRYSLDEEGIAYAGGTFNKSKYNTYNPDNDNIIPISDDDSIYYDDDIVGKFKEFIKVSFGHEHLNENLNYISEILGKKGTESNDDTIRRYFINDFYNDHIKMYQKRPIYWLFDSGKKNGFKCLVYLHRYDEQIVSKIRTKYLHNTISIYQRTAEEIDYKLSNEDLNTTDKRNMQNKKAELNAKITECNEYDEMVGNVANKMIKLDLDDGVVINYAKFVDDNGKSILAKIK